MKQEYKKPTICVWKKVAQNDLEKKLQDTGEVTFREDSSCFSCNGYDACPKYVPYRDRVANEN